jgi:hypothetical protein
MPREALDNEESQSKREDSWEAYVLEHGHMGGVAQMPQILDMELHI